VGGNLSVLAAAAFALSARPAHVQTPVSYAIGALPGCGWRSIGLDCVSARTIREGPAALKRVFVHLACMFLLLFAQQAALTHAAWHATHKSPPVQHEGNGKASFQGGLCNLHVAFSQVLGGASACALPPRAAECFIPRAEHRERSHHAAVSLPFFSRGPPVLL